MTLTTVSTTVLYCETNETLLLMQIDASCPRVWGMKRSILGSGGQRSRSLDAKVRFGDLAEAPVSIP